MRSELLLSGALIPILAVPGAVWANDADDQRVTTLSKAIWQKLSGLPVDRAIAATRALKTKKVVSVTNNLDVVPGNLWQ